MAVQACSPSVGGAEIGGSLRIAGSQSSQIGERQVW